MPTLTYIGGHAEVTVPLPDGREILVAKDATGDFPDTLAASLLEQPDNWKTSTTTKTPATGEKE